MLFWHRVVGLWGAGCGSAAAVAVGGVGDAELGAVLVVAAVFGDDLDAVMGHVGLEGGWGCPGEGACVAGGFGDACGRFWLERLIQPEMRGSRTYSQWGGRWWRGHGGERWRLGPGSWVAS